MENNPPRKKVAVVGTGMAGLIIAYILKNDHRQRFEVEVFEKQDKLSLDSASHTISTQGGDGENQERLDLPMRAIADGYYENLKRMYDYFGITYGSRRFIYSLSTLPKDLHEQVNPYYVHSSNNHQIPPLRPEGLSWTRWLVETCYLAVCYYWFTACCFFVTPRTVESFGAEESLRQYVERIYLPWYYVKHYLLPMMSSVTTCSHDALLEFPAIDVVDYERKTFRKTHYTVTGGVQRVEKELSRGMRNRLATKVTSVENIGTEVKVSWTNTLDGQNDSKLFDHVILAVTPDVIGAIFEPLRSAVAAVPTTTVQIVIHRDFSKIIDCSKSLWRQIASNRSDSAPQPFHICSSAEATEATHEHPSAYLITNYPIAPIDPEKVVHTATLTRVLRSPTSRQIVNNIFGKRVVGQEKSQLWQNGDGNVWLVGSWCWDGMVLLEGCVGSAIRVANALGVQVPWMQ
ncbi:uncharacterized protein N7511_009542 [Penicillium nucicola]|uniref:uncharacterized protein n=1 Tax=Penicillium nucicola TaxID=1850975 RepID=UPI0025455C8A|nr:uncharacterized protein N7511_009542 [Penicillium nucicola]KAJ5747846.1 hypothetical protein N7511_009542 [Penicillium nucicola]